nr:MAG TPA: head closure knob [Caudoviricetes sp.]
MLNEFFNTDTIVEVKRNIKTKNEHGLTVQSWEVVYANIKCQLSVGILRATETGIINSSKNTYKILVNNDIDIKQNDILLVNKGGIEYKFKAGKPIKYTDFLEHQEIAVEEVDRNES